MASSVLPESKTELSAPLLFLANCHSFTVIRLYVCNHEQMHEPSGNRTIAEISPHELAAECAQVSDKLNNLLTGIQLKAGLLLQKAQSVAERDGLRLILEASTSGSTFRTARAVK